MNNNENSQYIVEMKNITKSFVSKKANDNITLQLKKGEIHALLGENGAGKSTLMSILFGLYQFDEGHIFYKGKEVKINNPNDATALGIGMVHQHFKLIDCFTVLDNIILGVEDTKLGFIEKKKATEKVKQLSKKYGLNLTLNEKVENITVGMQQKTEIMKMLYRDNEVLIFDEPTAVLTPKEIHELLIIMKELISEGKSILFITHKLNEIMQVADRCTVLRKGKCMGTVDIKDVDENKLSTMMVGHQVHLSVDKKEANPTDIVLEVKNLSLKSKAHKKYLLKNVSFNVKKGEIVCIAGIDGNGQAELIQAITGLENVIEGEIFLNNKNVTNESIRKRNISGLSHIPEDRHKYGLILDYSVEQNIVLQNYFENDFQNNNFIKFNEVRNYSDNLIKKFDIRSDQDSVSTVRSMSGGNQQKIIIAREMSKEHDLLIAVQPTRGLDVGAVEFIHKDIIKERDNGKGILLVSFELEEVLNLSDRILVMYEGEIVGEFENKNINIEELGLYMAGAKKQKMEVK